MALDFTKMESTAESVTAQALEPKELILTHHGLSHVNWEYDDDFEFLVDGNQSCRVHSILAEFLAPKVARLRKCDISCSFYTLKRSDLFDVFESLVSSLQNGQPLLVDESNFVSLLQLSEELENNEILSSLLGMINVESLTVTEAILLLCAGADLGTAFSDRLGDLKDFIASHFYEIETEILGDLDLETLQLLLSSPSLKIEDEDSLYDFVRYRSVNDLRFTSLFEFIYFEYLSVNRIKDFESFVHEYLLQNINSTLWARVCDRLKLEQKFKNSPRNINSPGIKFIYDSSKPLAGIIAGLTRECGGNVHDKGIVNVTASSFYGEHPSNHPKHAADLGTNSCFWSSDEENTWICYDFKGKRVIPTSYSVRTCCNEPGGEHLKDWIIEVSNDGSEESWAEIDRRSNNNDLNDRFVTVNFQIPHSLRKGFRFIRLKQIGRNHNGEYGVYLTSLEIFGTLCDE